MPQARSQDELMRRPSCQELECPKEVIRAQADFASHVLKGQHGVRPVLNGAHGSRDARLDARLSSAPMRCQTAYKLYRLHGELDAELFPAFSGPATPAQARAITGDKARKGGKRST
jgi:hypothetical protein